MGTQTHTKPTARRDDREVYGPLPFIQSCVQCPLPHRSFFSKKMKEFIVSTRLHRESDLVEDSILESSSGLRVIPTVHAKGLRIARRSSSRRSFPSRFARRKFHSLLKNLGEMFVRLGRIKLSSKSQSSTRVQGADVETGIFSLQYRASNRRGSTSDRTGNVQSSANR